MTVVGFGPQTVQTVTVWVKPGGIQLGLEFQLAVDPVQVSVTVKTLEVRPVEQMSTKVVMYSVVCTVVVTVSRPTDAVPVQAGQVVIVTEAVTVSTATSLQLA